MIIHTGDAEQLGQEAIRLEREADEHKRLGHWVLERDKRVAASGVRRRLGELRQSALRPPVRLG